MPSTDPRRAADRRARSPDDRLAIDPALVRALLAAQFPEWAHLPVRPVTPGGWDHRTFRLGEDLAVRLPSARRYAAQVVKEHAWLPRLAPALPCAIPRALALGAPTPAYPFPWSVRGWLPGEPAAAAPLFDPAAAASPPDSAGAAALPDPTAVARDLAEVLRALAAADPEGGPAPDEDNFFRGGALAVHDADTRRAIAALAPTLDAGAATAAWESALAARWQGPPVWVHGDVAPGNLLLADGALTAVIDFGLAAVGDPACDLVVAWTLFSGAARHAFRAALPYDEATWTRAQGWALWKALVVLAAADDTGTAPARASRRVLEAVLTEQGRQGPSRPDPRA